VVPICKWSMVQISGRRFEFHWIRLFYSITDSNDSHNNYMVTPIIIIWYTGVSAQGPHAGPVPFLGGFGRPVGWLFVAGFVGGTGRVGRRRRAAAASGAFCSGICDRCTCSAAFKKRECRSASWCPRALRREYNKFRQWVNHSDLVFCQ
jgi:hypothetical protein